MSDLAYRPGRHTQSADAVALGVLVVSGFTLEVLNGGAGAAALLLVVLAAALLRPRAAIAAIAAALPSIYHPVALAGGRWSLLEIAIGLAALSVGWRVLVSVFRGRSLHALFELAGPWQISVGAFALLAAGVVSLAFVADDRFRPDSVRELRWVILEPVVAFAVARWSLRRGGGALLVAAFVATGTAVAAAACLQLVAGSGVVIADGVERATGPYRHPNNLALYLDRVAIVALVLALRVQEWRRMLVPVAVVTAIGLAATLSRGAALAYVAGAATAVWYTRSRHGWRWLAAGGAAAVALLGFLGYDRLTDRGGSGATSSRQLIWSASIRMLRDHPITGVGLDQFLNQYNRRYVSPAGWPERYTSHPHDLLLDVWLRLGILGLVAAGLLIVAVLWTARQGRPSAQRPTLWIASVSALVAGLVHGLVDNGYFLPDLAAVTWLLVAMLEQSSTAKESGDGN